jgi:hypothetical protein
MLGLALVILLGMVLTLGGVTALLILWGGAEIAQSEEDERRDQ